jgi:hypothetical protein
MRATSSRPRPGMDTHVAVDQADHNARRTTSAQLTNPPTGPAASQ